MRAVHPRAAQVALAALGAALIFAGLGGGWRFTCHNSPDLVTSLAAEEDDLPTKIANSLDMKFVLIPRGKFLMGSPKTEAHRGDDEEQHEVVITKSFYLGVHEVTQSQYERIMGNNPSCFTPNGPGRVKVRAKETSQSPVESVTWYDTVAFCKKLGDRPEEREAKRTYRLPTEAQWEYACRASTTTALHYGDAVDSSLANFNGLSPYGTKVGGPFLRTTRRVGEYPANQFGLFDMHGNVMEWCNDWYAADYYQRSPKEDPQGPTTGREKVTRGGSWSNSGKACRSAVRTKLAPDDSHYGLGFRVVLVQGQ